MRINFVIVKINRVEYSNIDIYLTLNEESFFLDHSFISVSSKRKTQSNLLIRGSYVLGAQFKTLSIGENEVQDFQSTGCLVDIIYRYQLKEKKLSFSSELGLKQLYSKGNTQIGLFEAKTTKLIFGINAYYPIRKIWLLGLGLNVENNRDLKRFIFKRSDVFRQNILIRNEFNLSPKFFLTIDMTLLKRWLKI